MFGPEAKLYDATVRCDVRRISDGAVRALNATVRGVIVAADARDAEARIRDELPAMAKAEKGYAVDVGRVDVKLAKSEFVKPSDVGELSFILSNINPAK